MSFFSANFSRTHFCSHNKVFASLLITFDMNPTRLEHNIMIFPKLPELPKDLVRMEAYPATIALEGALTLLNQSPNPGKRRRPDKNHICVFDTEELEQETSAVERTLDFPMIEWQFTDETMSSENEFSVDTNIENGLITLLDNKNDWMKTGLRSKRRRCECNRLVRCQPFLSHLSLQVSSSALSQQILDKD
jgi:hypothetical protein